MPSVSLLLKELREHGLAMLSLAVAFFAVVIVVLEQQRAGTFSMSGFEVVRFSLLSIIPLIVFILGSRLIVREYVGHTRKFVEALPVATHQQLLIKYFIGIVYCLLLATAIVFFVTATASQSENIDSQYVKLVWVKTCSIVLLYWSLVFFISFTGRIRLVLYVVLGLALMFVINMPGLDQNKFPPIALMDRQLFVFERSVFPWTDILITLLISLVLALAAFALALVNDGSVAEQLGKPITRREFAAYAVLALGCLTVYGALQKKWTTESYELSGQYVLSNAIPAVKVSYLADENRVVAEQVMAELTEMLERFSGDMGLDSLPKVQVSLNTDLELTEIEPDLSDGVLVTANYLEYGEFEFAMLRSIAMHHLLLSFTNGRWDFETRHWLLDGLARWWAEGNAKRESQPSFNELIALALISERRLENEVNYLLRWQTLTDQFGFEGADALSYSAILYLEEVSGEQTLFDLAASYIDETVHASSLETINRLLNLDADRFMRITGIDLDEFNKQWLLWLREKSAVPEIQLLVDTVPFITADIQAVGDSSGAYRLEASYTAVSKNLGGASGNCVLRHQISFPYDRETMIYERNRDRQPCVLSGIAHSVPVPYAAGDRAYVLLEYENSLFHRPIPIAVERVHVQ